MRSNEFALSVDIGIKKSTSPSLLPLPLLLRYHACAKLGGSKPARQWTNRYRSDPGDRRGRIIVIAVVCSAMPPLRILLIVLTKKQNSARHEKQQLRSLTTVAPAPSWVVRNQRGNGRTATDQTQETAADERCVGQKCIRRCPPYHFY